GPMAAGSRICALWGMRGAGVGGSQTNGDQALSSFGSIPGKIFTARTCAHSGSREPANQDCTGYLKMPRTWKGGSVENRSMVRMFSGSSMFCGSFSVHVQIVLPSLRLKLSVGVSGSVLKVWSWPLLSPIAFLAEILKW